MPKEHFLSPHLEYFNDRFPRQGSETSRNCSARMFCSETSRGALPRPSCGRDLEAGRGQTAVRARVWRSSSAPGGAASSRCGGTGYAARPARPGGSAGDLHRAGGAVRMAEKWRIGCELSSEKGRSKLQSNFTPGILSHVSAPWPLRGCPWHRHCFSSAAGMQWEFQELWHGAMYTVFSLGHLSSQLLPPTTRIPSYLILGCEIGGQKVLTGLPPVSQSPPHLFGSICAP